MSAQRLPGRLAGLGVVMTLAACAGSPRSDGYSRLVSDSTAAYAMLARQADALVAAGALDAARVGDVEGRANGAIEALARAQTAVAGARNIGQQPDLATLLGSARQMRDALTSVAALLPSGTQTPATAAALRLADALLDAFLALGPGVTIT